MKEFDDNYFINRFGCDKKRLRSFESEKKYISSYVDFNKSVLDIGCSTGEFLHYLGWSGQKFGMEINRTAIESAVEKKISFSRDIFSENNFFDTIIFRGTIQHLPDPFGYLMKSINSLKPKGIILLLATPNCESYIFRLTGTLPALDKPRVFYYPQPSCLENFFLNHGCTVLSYRNPYLNCGYDNVIFDVFSFIKCYFNRKKISPKFAWPGNNFDMVIQKNE